MAGWFEGLTDRGVIPVLSTTLSFTQARHRVIAENVANLGTPGYKAKHLDQAEFERALGEAVEQRNAQGGGPLQLAGGQAITDGAGRLVTTPRVRPGDNLVFHDGTNVSIEREMSDLAANAMLNEITSDLLRGRFASLRKAISGRV